MGLVIKIKAALFDGFFFLQHFFCDFSNSGKKHTFLNGIAFGGSSGALSKYFGNIIRYAKKFKQV